MVWVELKTTDRIDRARFDDSGGGGGRSMVGLSQFLRAAKPVS